MTETLSKTEGKIVWFELPADDTTRAQSFYRRLFGWQFQNFDGPFEYHMTYEAGGAIQPATGEKAILVYFGTDAIDAAISRVRDLGGEASDPQEITGVGTYSHCIDSEGNRFGLYEGGGR